MNFFEKLLITYRNSSTENMTEETLKSDNRLKTGAAILLCAASLILTVMNIVKQYWFMTGMTLLLSFGFGAAAVLCGILHERKASVTIMAILVALIFSVFAVTGENEGFAILWIIIVPSIAMSVLGLKVGTAVSIYFQLFLVVLLYTPLRSTVSEHYTETFMMRFPVLYLTGFAASFLLAVQKEFYFQKTERTSYTDTLTGLNNRRAYDADRRKIIESGNMSGLTLIEVDVNRLKFVNDTFGHDVGDRMIIHTAVCLKNCFKKAEAICRTGGDEFMIVSYQPPEVIQDQIAKLHEAGAAVREEPLSGITFSVGSASQNKSGRMSFEELEKTADTEMYKSKSEFYRKSGLDRRR